MVSDDKMDLRHSHGPQHQHMPRISAWSPVAVQTTNINTALCHCTGHRHHHSPPWQHKPRTSAWPQWQHRPLRSTQHSTPAQATESTVFSTDHGQELFISEFILDCWLYPLGSGVSSLSSRPNLLPSQLPPQAASPTSIQQFLISFPALSLHPTHFLVYIQHLPTTRTSPELSGKTELIFFSYQVSLYLVYLLWYLCINRLGLNVQSPCQTALQSPCHTPLGLRYDFPWRQKPLCPLSTICSTKLSKSLNVCWSMRVHSFNK